MKEKLKTEFYRLINQYRHTKSNVLKDNIIGTLEGIYDTCKTYGIDVPEISELIIGYNGPKSIWFDFNQESFNFIKEISEKINNKLIKPNFLALNKINEKVDGEKYGKIIAGYLKEYKRDLYDLYIKMEKENRFFEIETGLDNNDSDYFTIPYLHENSNIVVIDSFTNLSNYFGIVHELAHVNYYEKYKFFGKPAKFDVYNNLVEVYPIYTELLLGEYLKTIKLTNKNYAYQLTKNQLMYPSDELLNDYDPHFMGNILALSFYDMYLEDKEKTEYNFEQFLRNYEGNDFETNLNSYGLNKEKILSLKAIERD